LLFTGPLLDAKRGYGPALTVAAIGEMIAAAIIWFTFPETAHKELEELNPEDAVGEIRVL
jgi:hypothetical protein